MTYHHIVPIFVVEILESIKQFRVCMPLRNGVRLCFYFLLSPRFVSFRSSLSPFARVCACVCPLGASHQL